MSDLATVETGSALQDFRKGIIWVLEGKTRQARQRLELAHRAEPIGNVRSQPSPPSFDGVDQVDGEPQHEGNRHEELVPQTVVHVIDQPLQAGDLPRRGQPLGFEAAANFRQQSRSETLPLDNRQDLRENRQSRRGLVRRPRESPRLTSVRDGDHAVDNQGQQERGGADVSRCRHGQRGERQQRQQDRAHSDPATHRSRPFLRPGDEPVLIEILVHLGPQQGNLLAEIDVGSQLLDSLLPTANHGRIGRRQSHWASTSSPKRVRAWQSSSNNDPLPKRSRSSA